MKLPDGDEPLILADGTKIDPSSGKVIRDNPKPFTEIVNPVEAQKIVSKVRRTVSELPVPPAQLSGVALVAFYTLFGLTDTDICIAVENKLSIDQITNIRKQEAYQEFMASAKQNILHTETTVVRDLFEQNAIMAAQRVVGLITNEDTNEVLAFKASQDILDRAGHRPADIVEHRHKMEDTLNIVITKRDETNQLPMIDVTPAESDA